MRRPHAPVRLLRRADIVIVLLILLVAGVLWLAAHWGTGPGKSAMILTPYGEQKADLSRDRKWTQVGRDGLTVTLEVKDGRIRFAESGCPDQVCVSSGWLSKAGQTAACVPAGITVRVTGETPVDMIAG